MVKIYKTKKSLVAAIKRNGLHLMNYEIVPTHANPGYYANFFCALLEDVEEIKSRGFDAEFSPENAAN